MSTVAIILLTLLAVALGALGAALMWNINKGSMKATRRWLERQGYSREEATAEVNAVAARQGWTETLD